MNSSHKFKVEATDESQQSLGINRRNLAAAVSRFSRGSAVASLS